MSKKQLLISLASVLALLGSQTVHSQSIIPARVDAIPIMPSLADAHHVNCDMVYHAGGGHLRAIAYDDYARNDVNVYLEDYTGGRHTVNIPNAKGADIVIGDDLANPGRDYLLNVVYTTANYEVWFDIYKIMGTGSSSLNSSIIHSQRLSAAGSVSTKAHIDLWPDVGININGLASLHNFAITWTDYGSTGHFVYLTHGDLQMPSITNTMLLSRARGEISDVAALFDLSTRNAYAYVPFFTAIGDLDLAEVNLTTNSIVGITNGLDHDLAKNIRIEAMNQYDPSNGMAKYQILYQVLTSAPSTASFKMMAYNDLVGSYDVSSAQFSREDNIHPAVAGGVGPVMGSGSYSNTNYSILWEAVQSRSLPTQAVDATTGNINALYPDYYLANFNLLGRSVLVDESPAAISSSSNDGRGLLTAWASKNRIWYKYNNDVTSYKPTSVTGTIPMVNLKLFPNPATDILNIETATAGNYTIADITGCILLKGTVSGGTNKVDVSILKSGFYTITIGSATDKNTVKFQKH